MFLSAGDVIPTRSSNLIFFEILGNNKKKERGILNTLLVVVVVGMHWGTAGTTASRMVVSCHTSGVLKTVRDLTIRFHRHVHPVP